MTNTIDLYKNIIHNKDQTISKQLVEYKELENKLIELQIELSTVHQKLGLK